MSSCQDGLFQACDDCDRRPCVCKNFRVRCYFKGREGAQIQRADGVVTVQAPDEERAKAKAQKFAAKQKVFLEMTFVKATIQRRVPA